MKKYVALLRGINVGGNHIVPMAQLKCVLQDNSFQEVKTILNSGNIIFQYNLEEKDTLERKLEELLLKTYLFEIPVILLSESEVNDLLNLQIFRKDILIKDLRFYVTFSKNDIDPKALEILSNEESLEIVFLGENFVCTILNVSIKSSTKAMLTLEKTLGKSITTRNWNTLLKIKKQL